jgi:hypothetical protein
LAIVERGKLEKEKETKNPAIYFGDMLEAIVKI